MNEKNYIDSSPDEWFKRQQEKKKSLLKWLSISALLRVLTMSAYYGFRLKCMLGTHDDLTQMDVAVAWTFFTIECLFAGTPSAAHKARVVLLTFTTPVARLPSITRSLSVIGKAKVRPAIYLQGTRVPCVDIFITACGEDLSTILDTVRAACNIDYPTDKYRVIILDDGNSPACKQSIQLLRQEYPNLRYTARGALVKTHSKAANLNHGLDFVLQEGPHELIAVLDVDMIPEPNWLRSILPHIVQDQNVALANPPQCFYDLPKQDPASHLSAACHMCNVATAQQDCSDEAWCNGSGFVARRKAIDHIGGFPTECLLEDKLTSMRLQSAGWKCVLVNEPLQWGSVPDTFAKNVKQMQRWTAGSLTLAKAASRPSAWLLEADVAMAILKSFFCFTALPILLITGSPFLTEVDPERLRPLLSLAYLDFAVHCLQGLLEAGIADYCISILQDYAQLWMSHYLFPDLFRWLFPWITHWCCPNFKPSGCFDGDENTERYRNSLLKRLEVILWNDRGLVHVFIFITCLAGVITSAINTLQTSSPKGLHWVLHAGYPPALLLWTSVLCNAWIPISYAIWTPHRPNRETLLFRDPGSQVAYPTAAAKDQGHRKSGEVQFQLVLLYYVGILVASQCF